ncbi:MAG: cobalamin-independent methionine synthase II family protein [Chloroflexi bacterium]|nr:cobalamin-independent methionine synthase II family protein [Chloroflexota bacterium]MDA1269641.1 cobalamin-independent methionine synthase II family protein [Chloroflexota bacterium]
MKRSESRILTTHTGSLPRSPELQELLRSRLDPKAGEEEEYRAGVEEGVADVVARQAAAGIDVINDGEQGRVQYATYVKDRLTGFDGEQKLRQIPRKDMLEFPEFAAQTGPSSSSSIPWPACTGPIAWKDRDAVQRDIQRLQSATAGVKAEEVFMTAASPGVIANFLHNEYYPSEEEYLYVLADVMKDDYKAIVDSGLLLQIDCPDLAMTRITQFSHLSEDDFIKIVEMHVEVLQYALAGLPADRMRMHLCWGNTEGPHHLDVPLKKIVNTVLKVPTGAISFEGANPRHAHEWKVWEDVKLPEGKIIVPGVLDTTTNFIEHPELIAQRIGNYAGVVGKENMMVGSDCGFGTSAWGRRVESRIAWAKLASMVEGARLASEELW